MTSNSLGHPLVETLTPVTVYKSDQQGLFSSNWPFAIPFFLVKGHFEYHYLCNCKLMLYAFAITNATYQHMTTMLNFYKKTLIIPESIPQYLQHYTTPKGKTKHAFGFFVKNYNLQYLPGYYVPSVASKRTDILIEKAKLINEMYTVLC